MILIGAVEKWATWEAVGVSFLLSPLSLEDKQACQAAARVQEKDAGGAVVRTYTSTVRYAQLIGQRCIKDWRPAKGKQCALVDARTRQPVPYSPGAIDAVMTMESVADWIVSKVESHTLYVETELEAAGNV